MAKEFINNPVAVYEKLKEGEKVQSPGMKYKHLKALYNYREFTPTLADRYSPAWSGYGPPP